MVCSNYFSKAEGVINVGINGFDQLGCEITSKYPMPNYQYDCTNPTQTPCSSNRNANQFYYQCVGSRTERNDLSTFVTLQDILKRHNLTKKHIIYKTDCEGCEYESLKYFPTEDLDHVDVILG